MSGKGAKTRQRRQDRGEEDSSASEPQKQSCQKSQEEVAVPQAAQKKATRGRPKQGSKSPARQPRKNPSPMKRTTSSAAKEVQDPPVQAEVQGKKSRGPARKKGKAAKVSVSTIYRFVSLQKNNEVLFKLLRLLYI